jgi:hypothetical protein
MGPRKFAVVLACAIASLCGNAAAQAPVQVSPAVTVSPAPSSGPPSYACEDQWAKGADGQWTLTCKTGFCGAGGNGEKCDSQGKNKEGRPTCECKRPAVQPPPKPGTDEILKPCPDRAQCGGECVAKLTGKHGKCNYGIGGKCLCSAGILGGGGFPSIPTSIPTFGR